MSKEKTLEHHEFQLLLAWLEPEVEHGSQSYLNFHKRLTTVFLNDGCGTPEELADETLNRVARQLADGKEITTGNRFAYLYGIAKNIRHEYWRKAQNEKPDEFGADNEATWHGANANTQEEADAKERRLQCLDHCLNRLPDESRLLMLEYYAEDKGLKIDIRGRMASRLGIASAVLRNRIYKLRNSLRSCVVECIAN